MTPLEAARRLDCLCDSRESNHSDVCILTIKPRIVAALEAAERMTGVDPWYVHESGIAFCIACGDYGRHREDCAYAALVTAMQDVAVTA